jgi:hypothetical protein
MTTISIIGSGNMATAFGTRAARRGHTVELISRDSAKAQVLADQFGHGATVGAFGAPAAGDISHWAYVDADGWAQLSKRGTALLLDGRTLAVWARNRRDGLATSISQRPPVTLQYVDLANRDVLYTFHANANISADPAVVDRVWQGMPEAERQQDRDRHGLPVVVDLRQVVAQSRRPDRNFTLRR